ncbi:MAG TPA: SusD/RagB family nutrient-binding outer membrane lipoprotein [Gemmatimonadaceae bacterium]|nr:SusD/RagB family nutrient-binding outer membrane lipoprotein [Gemmatimonadaceae bacterium]
MKTIRAATRAGVTVALAASVFACDSLLDVNDNPNAPEQAPVEIRLPALIAMFAHSTYYGENSLWGAEWLQQFSYNRATRSYAEVHRYELAETDASTAWDYYYTRPGNESRRMIQDASDPADIYYRGLAKLFNAWTFQVITDLWGPVPCDDAGNPAIREPRYDEQKAVYTHISTLLDEAIADLSSPTGRRPTSNDLLFAGDMTRWIKVAHFLQARMNIRLAYAQGEDQNARANAALSAIASGLASNSDDADFIYPGGANARNPNWTFQDQRNLLVASEFMVELLKGGADPRLPIMFTPIVYDSIRGTTRYPSLTPTYVGHRNGSDQLADSTVSWIGPFFSNETAPLNLVSFADQKFTEAEARLIVSGAAAADAPYRDGIRANMQKLGVATAAIDAYLAARPALSTLTDPLEEIIEQKYVANFLKVEPWNDWRRTGYPVVPAPVEQAVLSGIPQRIRTPGSELSTNINQVLATGIPTGLEGMLVKVWWATR